MNYLEIKWPGGTETYAKSAIHFAGYQALPLLLEIRKMVQAIRIDGIENYTAEFILSDYDGHFTNKLETEPLKERPLTYRNEEKVFFRGWISTFPEATGNTISIKADTFTVYNKYVNSVITSEAFENCPPQNLGKYSNYIYGDCDALPGLFTARRIDTDTFLAAWNPLSDVSTVTDQNGTAISTYQFNVINGYTYISCQSGDDFVKFTGKGPVDESQNVISNPAQIIDDLLSRCDEFNFISIANLAEAKDVYDERGYQGTLFITGNETFKDLFNNFQQSFNCFLGTKRNNNISIRFLTWGTETANMTIHPAYISNFTKSRITEHLKKNWVRKYLFNLDTNTYERTMPDIESAFTWSTDVGTFTQKYLSQDDVSYSVALRDKFLKEKPLLSYCFDVPISLGNEIQPGDTVSFKHKNSFSPDESRLMFIQRIERTENKGIDRITGFDISEIQKKTMMLYEEGNSLNPVLYQDGDSRNPVLWYSN